MGLHRKKDIFIICERWHEARDNGYFLFEYLRRTYPEKPVYYIFNTSKKNLDYQKLLPLGNVLPFPSLPMFIYLYYARYVASPHTDIMYLCRNWLGDKIWQKKTTAFLQHGVTTNKLGDYYKNEISQFSIIICGAAPEYKFLQEESLGLDIIPTYVGFARWDRLYSAKAERTILVMPTWRRNLVLPVDGAEANLQKRIAHLEVTDYYQRWQAFINSPRLGEILQKNGVKVVFYAHPNLYNELGGAVFSSQNPLISIANPQVDDLSAVIEHSALLVTDFSSIFWDFAYMGRPVIYYQFDEAEFRASQWQEGYFSYKRDGFGSVSDSLGDVLDGIEFYIDHNFKMESEYRAKTSAHFILHDARNCERNFQAIVNVTKGGGHG